MKDKEVTLITGASSGIGYELAKTFAEKGHNLVLVARSGNKLQQLAEELMKKENIKAYVITEDLSRPEAAKALYRKVQQLGLQVDILVNNAGFGYVGLFHEEDIQKDVDMLQVNITTLTELTKFFGKEMVERRRGGILNVASTGAYHPGPFTAVYYASKAYVLSFSEAIARELKPYNVTVTAVCPGATKTNFSKRAGKRDNNSAMGPGIVAKIAYQGLLKRKAVVIPGVANKLFTMLPRKLVKGMVESYQRKLAGK